MSDVKGIEVHNILGFSEPATKLIETISSAIGTLYAPFGVKRMAKAKAFELQAVSEAISDNINLPTSYSAGDITVSSQDYDELVKRASTRVFYQELRKQQNIEAIVELAGMELEKERAVSDEPVDPDWTIRFFNSVEDVSNEDMQKLWGRVLSGEVKRPKRFSIRTLETLRNMSHEDALLFQKLSNYCFYIDDYPMLIGDDDLLKKHDLSYVTILSIEACGLINSTSLGCTHDFLEDPVMYLHNDTIIGCVTPSNEELKEIELGIYYLTEAGAELYRVVDRTSNDQCFIEFMQSIKHKTSNCTVSAYRIKQITDGVVDYSDEYDLLLEKE